MTLASSNAQAKNVDYGLNEPSRTEYEILAHKNGWSPAYAKGHIEGDLARVNNKAPAIYIMVGVDEYCLGFRASYFATDRCQAPTLASIKSEKRN